DFYWAYPHALHLHHVVITAYIPVVTVRVAIVFVPSADPVALDDLFGLLMLVPVAGADGVTFNEQASDLTIRNVIAILIHDARLIAGHDLSARSRPHSSGPVGDEHVQRFRRSNG